MWKKTFSMGIVAVAAFAMAFAIEFPQQQQLTDGYSVFFSDAEARRGGGGFRSSSRSFSRPSVRRSSSNRSSKSLWNRSSSKPKARTTTRPAASKKSSGGYKKATKPRTTTKPIAKKSATAKAAQRKQAAKTMKRKETSKFKKQPPKTSAATMRSYRKSPVTRNVRRVNTRTYYTQRNSYYAGSGWHRPSYFHRSYSSFGLYDAAFMWMMLDRHNSMYYHHRRDSSFVQWRREADRLSRDNAELRAKLNKLDGQMTTMQGTPVNKSFTPKGVPANVMLSEEVVTSQQGELVMGTGGKAGNYYAFCKEIQKNTTEGMNVKCENTNGSVANLNGMLAGKYGAIMVQSDVYNEWLRKNPGQKIDGLQSTVYPEVVFLLANKKAGVKSIDDVNEKKHRIYYAGGGAVKTMVGFARQDRGYAPLLRAGVKVSPNAETLKMVANNPNGVMFYVCGMECPLIRQANNRFGDKLVMAAVDDWDFNDAEDQFGKNIYRFVKIPKLYPKLQSGGMFSSADVESLAVEAVLIVSKDWVEQQGADGMAKLEKAIWPAMDAIQTKVGVPE